MAKPAIILTMQVKEVEENGQKKLIIENQEAVAEVFLFGATVTKFKTASGKDLIWLSSTAKLDGTKAIRGGIPLVFPQFGQPIKEMAQHGFARNNVWTFAKQMDDKVVLTLDNTQATHDAWKHPYKLYFKITVEKERLLTQLVVQNTGSESFTFQCLQHTYLNVGDIAQTKISGFSGSRYLDKTSADPTALVIETSNPEIKLKEFTDRVYLTNPAVVVDSQPTGHKIEVRGWGLFGTNDRPLESAEVDALDESQCLLVPSDTVMWNPWEEKAKGMNDFDDDGYLKMLCIEPGLVSGFHVLPPGKLMALCQELKAS